MFKSKKKKMTALILSAFMTVSVAGTALVSANPNDGQPPIPQQQDQQHHKKINHQPQQPNQPQNQLPR